MNSTTRPPRTPTNAERLSDRLAGDIKWQTVLRDALREEREAGRVEAAAPDAGLRKALAAMIDHHDNTTDHDDCVIRGEARRALAAHRPSDPSPAPDMDYRSFNLTGKAPAGPAVDVDRLARALERFDVTAYNVDPHGIALDAYEAARDIAIEYTRLTSSDPTGEPE